MPLNCEGFSLLVVTESVPLPDVTYRQLKHHVCRLANVLLVGGGSGHGFKHGPEVGRYAAARLFGAVKAEPRFSLSTKGETQRREVH